MPYALNGVAGLFLWNNWPLANCSKYCWQVLPVCYPTVPPILNRPHVVEPAPCCWTVLLEKWAFGPFFQILLAGATCMLPYRAPRIKPATWRRTGPCFPTFPYDSSSGWKSAKTPVLKTESRNRSEGRVLLASRKSGFYLTCGVIIDPAKL